MTNYHGHTEAEANELLHDWLSRQEGYCWWIDNFTHSLDSCRLIENRLTDEQMQQYITILIQPTAHSSSRYYTFKALVSLDAPTRVQALLKVLNLAKPESLNTLEEPAGATVVEQQS